MSDRREREFESERERDRDRKKADGGVHSSEPATHKQTSTEIKWKKKTSRFIRIKRF